MSTAREKILQTASELMEKQGYHGTGLNEIIQKSGAPKGSLYYYFPEGKEQIASEAVLRAGQIVSEGGRRARPRASHSRFFIHDRQTHGGDQVLYWLHDDDDRHGDGYRIQADQQSLPGGIRHADRRIQGEVA